MSVWTVRMREEIISKLKFDNFDQRQQVLASEGE